MAGTRFVVGMRSCASGLASMRISDRLNPGRAGAQSLPRSTSDAQERIPTARGPLTRNVSR